MACYAICYSSRCGYLVTQAYHVLAAREQREEGSPAANLLIMLPYCVQCRSAQWIRFGAQSRLRAKRLTDRRLSVPIVAGQLAIQNAVPRWAGRGEAL